MQTISTTEMINEMFYSYNNNQHFCYSRRYLFLQRHRYKQDKNVTFIWKILPVSLGNFAACFPPINTRPKLPRLDTKLASRRRTTN
jgi:hypothetical protein